MYAVPLDLDSSEKWKVTDWWVKALYKDLESRKRMPTQVPSLILAILTMCSDSLVCRISTQTLRRECRMGSKAVTECFEALVSEGWLIQTGHANRKSGLAAEYRLSVPSNVAFKFSKNINPVEWIKAKNTTLSCKEDADEQPEKTIEPASEDNESPISTPVSTPAEVTEAVTLEVEMASLPENPDRHNSSSDLSPSNPSIDTLPVSSDSLDNTVDVLKEDYFRRIEEFERAERLEAERASKSFVKDEVEGFIKNTFNDAFEVLPEEDPKLTEDIFEDFRSMFGIKLGNKSNPLQEPESKYGHLRLVS